MYVCICNNFFVFKYCKSVFNIHIILYPNMLITYVTQKDFNSFVIKIFYFCLVERK